MIDFINLLIHYKSFDFLCGKVKNLRVKISEIIVEYC